MQEVLSMQGYLPSDASGSVMQGVLSSGARGSVTQEDLSHARGSVILCKGICHQSVEEVHDSCKRFCLTQEYLSCKGFWDPMQEYLSCKGICHARGSVSRAVV